MVTNLILNQPGGDYSSTRCPLGGGGMNVRSGHHLGLPPETAHFKCLPHPSLRQDNDGNGWHDASMDTGKPEHEARALEEVVERLVDRFPDVPEVRVRETVRAASEEFANRPIRDFVPVFVERSARDALSHLPTA